VEGRRAIDQMAFRFPIPYRRCGKLIVAAAIEEIPSLERLRDQGEENGAAGLRILDPGDVRALEPHVRAVAGLLSPETAIVDSHALVETFRALAASRGAALLAGAEVIGLAQENAGWRVDVRRGHETEPVTCRAVVNSAGLHAQEVMRLAGLDPEALGVARYLWKGEYFGVRGERARYVRSLVYPSPLADLVGLGIHSVVDLAGGLRLGPDATYVDEIDYSVDPAHAGRFVASVRPFLPFLEPKDLAPAMAGIRPKLAGPGQPPRDFHIAHEMDHGAAGMFTLAGIESPGLTASPAIGRLVAGMVADWLGA
jgi:L-2-hydroxyglutarate oxidase LhgO